MLSGRVFVGACAIAALAIVGAGRLSPMPVGLLAAEVLATILGMFVLGSFRYQLHKNALTYGMLLVIGRDVLGLPTSTWHVEIAQHGGGGVDPHSTCCRLPGSTSWCTPIRCSSSSA